MKYNWKLSSALVTMVALGSAVPTANAQTAQASAGKAAAEVNPQDIVVTATRRDEKLNRVPLAIQALSGKMLEQLNVTNFEKLVEYLPDVRTASRGPGVSSIYIRGLSTDTAGAQILGVAGVQPNVALYVNDAPASTPGRNLDIHPTDMNRIEVLEGPQGTLFGASAMGGAIRYITNKPDLTDFHAGFTLNGSTTKHGAASYSGEGWVNIPVIKDKLAVRLSAYSDTQGGYIDNVAGTYQMPWNPTGGPGGIPSGNPLLVAQAIASCYNVANCTANATGTTGGFKVPIRQSITNTAFVAPHYNDASYNGGRAEATWKINDDWSLEGMELYQALKSDGVFDYSPGVGDLQVQQYGPNSLKDTINMTTLTLKGRLSILDVIYTSSFLDHHSVQQADYAKYANIGLYMPYYNCDRGVYYAGYANSKANGQTCYSPANSYKVDDRNRRWTQEFRVTTPADQPLRATLGGFYDVNRIYDVTQWNYVLPAAGFTYNLAPSPATNILGTGPLQGAGFVNDILRRDRQFSIYGEVSYDIIPKTLIATFGGRYYNESAYMGGGSSSSFAKGVRENCGSVTTDPTTGLTTCVYTPLATPPTTLGTSANLSTVLAGIDPATYSGGIFKGNLTYKATPDDLFYATFSQGYRPGGFNRKGANGGFAALNASAALANRAYAPDKVNNYELGAKMALLNHKVQINLAAYVVQWTGIQAAVFDQNISNQTFINNLLNARIHGIEGDFNARPSRGLTIGGGFSYNDTKVTGCVQSAIAQLLCTQGVIEPAGTPLALAPKFQGNIRFRYEWEQPSGLKPFVGAGLHYVGSTISSDVANTNILYTGCTAPYATCGKSATINGVTVKAGDPIQLQPSSFAQPSYTTFEASIGASKDQWTIEIYGENLSDARPQLFTSANDGEKRVTTSRPRTFGMRVSVKM